MKKITQLLFMLFCIINLNAQVELDLRPLNLESSESIEFTKIENESISNFFEKVVLSTKTDEPLSVRLINSEVSETTFTKEIIGSDVEVKYGLETFNMDVVAFKGYIGENEILIFSSDRMNSIIISNQHSIVEIFRDIDKESGEEEINFIKNPFEEDIIEPCAQCEHPDNEGDRFNDGNKSGNRAGLCKNNDEYLVDVGFGSDFSYFVANNQSFTQVLSRMSSSFMIARDEYLRCNMRVFLRISAISIETQPYQLFNTPFPCTFYPNSLDALHYNYTFAASPGLPAGDVATLFTSWYLRGFQCFGSTDGMALYTDGVCDWNNTNIVESPTGGSRGHLTAHEIGHNLGVGIFHESNPPGYFYEDWEPIWHSNVVNAIHSNLDTKNCVDHFEYCCVNFQDIYLCEGELEFCVDLPSCGGTYTDRYGDRISGKLCGGPGYYTVNQFTSFTGCEFNSTSFWVYDCVGKGNSYGNTPQEFRKICLYAEEPICVNFPCVDSWDILDANGFYIQTNRSEVCIFPTPSNPLGISTIRLRPRLSCGGIASIVSWTIEVEDCGDGPKWKINPEKQSETTLVKGQPEETKFEENKIGINLKSSVYPNPTSDLINIKSEKEIEVVEIFDLNGKLLITTSQFKNINTNTINKQLIIVKISYTDKTTEYQKVFKIK